MINNFDYVQKNNAEIFKKSSYELGQGLDNLIAKLNEIRDVLYKCGSQQIRPLSDSSHDADCVLINKLIKQNNCQQKKDIFQKSIEVLFIYREQFIQIDRSINKKLKNVCDLHQRNSFNRKIYENIMIKRQEINNYFYSIQDADSPTKIKSDVFKF